MQEILNQYFIEFTVGAVIIIFIILFALLKKPKSEKIVTPKEEEETETVDEKLQEVSKPKLEPKKVLTEEEPTNKTDRVKREIIPHNKIKKDDFSIFKNAKIIIAEDNFINQKVITSLLADSGIYISIANDGQECLDILEKDSDFSVILMDAHMPILDGFEATKLIRKNPKYNHIPVVALSGDTAVDDIKHMMDSGMEEHLEKPLRMGPLYDILYMYTTGNEGKDKSSKSSNLAKEFDSEKGLDICGGDREFYLEILSDFTSNYSDSSDKLQEYLSNTNTFDADKLLLDISGIAANIGADKLHKIAISLKDSIDNHPTDLDYINDLKEYKRSLIRVCEAIKKYRTS